MFQPLRFFGASASRLEAIASKLEGIALGWRPLLVLTLEITSTFQRAFMWPTNSWFNELFDHMRLCGSYHGNHGVCHKSAIKMRELKQLNAGQH